MRFRSASVRHDRTVSAYQLSLSSTLLILVCFLTVYGGVLRFFELSSQSLWMDEAFSVVHAKAILRHGYPLLEHGGTSWSYALIHYLMAAGSILFPGDIHFSARFFPALAGVLLIPVFFLFNREISGSGLQAFTATAFQTFMTYQIAWSRQARCYSLLQLFIILSVLLWLLFVRKKQFAYLFFSLAFAGLSVLTHRAGFVAPLFILFCCVFDFPASLGLVRQHVKNNKLAFCMIVLLSLVFAALFLFSGTNTSFVNVVEGLLDSSGMNYFGMYSSFLAAGLFRGMVVWIFLGVCFAFFERRRFWVPLFLCVAAYLLVISFRTRLFHLRYLLPVLPFFLSFAAQGFASVMKRICLLHDLRVRGGAAALLCVCFFAALPFQEISLIPSNRYYLGYTAPQPDWRGAFEWVKNDHAASGPDSPVRVITPFPALAEIYMAGCDFEVFFLPFSFSGAQADFQNSAPYSKAVSINDPAEIRNVGGYIVLDAFGLVRLKDEQLGAYLRKLKPTSVVNDNGLQKIPVFIWKVSPV